MTVNVWMDKNVGLYTIEAREGDDSMCMECLSESEVNALTIGEIKRMMREARTL